MGIIVAYCTAKFASQSYILNVSNLLADSICEICILFTKSCWRGWLTMGPCEHGIISPLYRFICYLIENIFKGGDYKAFDWIREHERVCQVIDVFTGTTKVNKCGVYCDILFDKILDWFEVMIGRFFNGFDSLSRNIIEILPKLLELRFQFLYTFPLLLFYDVGSQQMEKPLSFNFYPIFHEGSLRKVLIQLCGLFLISTI